MAREVGYDGKRRRMREVMFYKKMIYLVNTL